jgi:hypothetical protein
MRKLKVLKKKEWYAKVKADGDCRDIACDDCPFDLERGITVCLNISNALRAEGKSAEIGNVCKILMAKLEKKWAKKAEKLKELGGGI